MDGPYGAATTDIFHYKVSMCIAAGIGVTPFASVLKSIWYISCNPNTELILEKVGGSLFMIPFKKFTVPTSPGFGTVFNKLILV